MKLIIFKFGWTAAKLRALKKENENLTLDVTFHGENFVGKTDSSWIPYQIMSFSDGMFRFL